MNFDRRTYIMTIQFGEFLGAGRVTCIFRSTSRGDLEQIDLPNYCPLEQASSARH